jgi:alpha-1,6-mannosyltransferase
MKTLHLTNYWHERSGGIATFYRHLLEAANRHEREMVLVVPGTQDEVEQVGSHRRIYKIAAPSSPLNRDYRTIYPREYLLPGSKIQRILASERPDLVEICDKYSLVHLGSLLRLRLANGLNFRPVVVGLTCERMDENFAAYVSRSWWGNAFSHWYMRQIYFPAFDHHIAVSDNTAAELKAVSNGHIVPRGVWVIPMGVNVEHFRPENRDSEMRRSLLERCGNSPDPALLLYVGRLAPEKNLELLIATMVQLERTKREFRLVLVGDGILREILEREARDRVQGKVLFLGHIEKREQLARIYASCDVFVHPNPTEPFGIAPLEAMASGLVLVAPDRGGVTQYANRNNSYLASPTPAAFAQAILEACEPNERNSAKRRGARETAESLAWPKVTESFLRFYQEIFDIVEGRRPLLGAIPAFVSSVPGTGHARCLSFASTLSQRAFAVYAWAHQATRAFSFHEAGINRN